MRNSLENLFDMGKLTVCNFRKWNLNKEWYLASFHISHLTLISHEIKRCLLLGRKVTTNLDSILKSRDITLSTKVRHYFVNKGPSSQGYGFSSGHVWMWELDYKESWVPKNWCFWTLVLEKTLESPLDLGESVLRFTCSYSWAVLLTQRPPNPPLCAAAGSQLGRHWVLCAAQALLLNVGRLGRKESWFLDDTWTVSHLVTPTQKT